MNTANLQLEGMLHIGLAEALAMAERGAADRTI